MVSVQKVLPIGNDVAVGNRLIHADMCGWLLKEIGLHFNSPSCVNFSS